MKKLKMQIDDLLVESFEPASRRGGPGAGSVHGRETMEGGSCDASDCGCEPLPSERPDCTEQASCYEPLCAETRDCSAFWGCSIENCMTAGEC